METMAPLFLDDHFFQHGFGHVIKPAQCDVDYGMPLSARHHDKQSVGRNTGVVDQNIDGALPGQDFVDRRLNGLMIRYIERHDATVAARLQDEVQGGESAGFIRAAVDDDIVSVGGQLHRDRAADSPAGPGDEGHFSAGTFIHGVRTPNDRRLFGSDQLQPPRYGSGRGV